MGRQNFVGCGTGLLGAPRYLLLDDQWSAGTTQCSANSLTSSGQVNSSSSGPNGIQSAGARTAAWAVARTATATPRSRRTAAGDLEHVIVHMFAPFSVPASTSPTSAIAVARGVPAVLVTVCTSHIAVHTRRRRSGAVYMNMYPISDPSCTVCVVGWRVRRSDPRPLSQCPGCTREIHSTI